MDAETRQASARLARRVHDRREERNRHEAVGNAVAERRKEIDAAPERIIMEFWCEDCKVDFVRDAVKQVRANDGWPLAYFETVCYKRSHRCIRRITDKWNDPYRWQSEHLKLTRAMHADDFLQPSDPRFRIKYPQQWAKLQAEQEAEREQQQAQQEHEHRILNG